MNFSEFQINTTYEVDVMQVNSPHCIYVRKPDITDFIKTIENPGSPLTANTIRCGQRVIFKSNELKKYVRGEVRFMNAQKAEFEVFAIDYGFYEKSVLLDCIYSLNREAEPLNQHPPLAVSCRLYLCEPLMGNDFPEKVKKYTKDLCGKEAARITVKGKYNDQLVVALYTDECGMDVADMLNLMDLTCCVKDNCNVNETFSSAASTSGTSALTPTLNYTHRNLKVGDTLHVTFQHGKSAAGFYVAEVNEYEMLINSKKNLQFCYDKVVKMRDEDIIPGIPCAVKVKATDMYDRAIVKEILKPNTTAVLTLVDYGREIEINFADIRYVSSESFYRQPPVAIFCSTDQHFLWSRLKDLNPGYQITIKITAVGKGFTQPHKVGIHFVRKQ